MKGYSFFSKLENSFSSRYPSVVMSCSRIYIFTTIFPAWQVSVWLPSKIKKVKEVILSDKITIKEKSCAGADKKTCTTL
jgi:hypothetical protein